MYKCICGAEFDNPQKFNAHKRNCKTHWLAKYGSLDKMEAVKQAWIVKSHQTQSKQAKERADQAIQQWIAEKHKCQKCGKVMTEKYGSGKFCSKSCANSSRTVSSETKQKISQSLRHNHNGRKQQIVAQKYYQENLKYCTICGKPIPYENRRKDTCSTECTHQARVNGGKKAAAINSEAKRSLNEKYFYELCSQSFQMVSHNQPIFNGWDADIIINDIKYAILWNGPWHYKEIMKNQHSSLKQIQSRDNIKIAEIINAGYTPYVIKDISGKFNKEFVEEQFNLFMKTLEGTSVGRELAS